MVIKFKFTKMQALGNDFVVIEGLDTEIAFKANDIKHLANRHFGVGCDQVLIIKPHQLGFFCQIFNADGSEAEQCGNGLRCIAYYLYKKQLCSHRVTLVTLAGEFIAEILPNHTVRLSLGIPKLLGNDYLPGTHYPLQAVSMGNPHAILPATVLETYPLESIISQLKADGNFPNGANIGFYTVISPQHIKLTTYERGSGYTLACGSNASAAVAAGISAGWLKSPVKVDYCHGSLTIEWQEQHESIYQTGPAVLVFTGSITI